MIRRTFLLFSGLFVFLVSVVSAVPEKAVPFEAKRLEELAAMLDEHPQGFGKPINDRKAWAKIAQIAAFKDIASEAERFLGKPVPKLTDDIYLVFSRTGSRKYWNTYYSQTRGRLNTLVLAECVENQGRFLPEIEKLVRAMCAEKTWLNPAHDRKLMNFHGKTISIDLNSASLSWSLATAHYFLSSKLSAETQGLIRTELERRTFEPFRKMLSGELRAWWLKGTNNWNAVCLAEVLGSALTIIESRDERAVYLAAAEHYIQNYLAGFTEDGYCSEGLAYWNYGFSHFLMLSEMIWQATKARVDLLEDEKVKLIAQFGARMEILPGVYPLFSDCSQTAKPAGYIMSFVSKRFGFGLNKWERTESNYTGRSLQHISIFAFGNSARRAAADKTQELTIGVRSWFKDAGVLICRPSSGGNDSIGAALKGGHNGEHHNHNDVGSFVVAIDGKAFLLDPGSEIYTARTFSPRRYESNVLNSYGHPVPVVAGKLQKRGRGARACILKKEFTDEQDILVLDIRSAYDVADLEKLQRSFIFSRKGSGSLTVLDEVNFAQPRSFGTALITFERWRQPAPGMLTVFDGGKGLCVDIEVSGGAIEITAEEIKEDLKIGRYPTRIGINFKDPVKKAVIKMTITSARTSERRKKQRQYK